MGPVRVISKIANLASVYDCSILCSFRDMTFFEIYFFSKSEIPNPVVGYCQSTIMDREILPSNMTAQILVVFEI